MCENLSHVNILTHSHTLLTAPIMSWASGICISIHEQETLVCTADMPDPGSALHACHCHHLCLTCPNPWSSLRGMANSWFLVTTFDFLSPKVFKYASNLILNSISHLCDFHSLSSYASVMPLSVSASTGLHRCAVAVCWRGTKLAWASIIVGERGDG